jgi:hypothetical protein
MALKINVRSLLAGLATPNQQGGILGGFQAGLGGALNQQSLQEKAAHDAVQAQLENDLKRRQVGAQEVSARADILRAQRGENDPANIAEYNFLTQKLGLDPEEAKNRIFPQRQTTLRGGRLGWLLSLPKPQQEEAIGLNTRLHPKALRTPKEPKPTKITRHGFTQEHTEQDYLNDINRDMSLMKPDEAAKFQSWLVSVYTGRAAGDSETLRRAAGARLRQIQGEGR